MRGSLSPAWEHVAAGAAVMGQGGFEQDNGGVTWRYEEGPQW